jgi:hypothetical protein
LTQPLVILGDSWPAGAELGPHEQPYGKILANLLQSTHYTNCAVSATSNEHMILQLGKYVKEQQNVDGHIAVFFLTYPGRSCLIDYNGRYLEVRPDANADKDSREYHYFKYFHTPLQEQFKTHQTILALQQMSSQLNLQDFYVVGWTPQIDFSWPGIVIERIYDAGKTTCADWLEIDPDKFETEAKLSKYVLPNQCHPNQQGHNIIAHKLYEWIKDKIV